LVTINNAPSLQLTTGMTLEVWVYPTTVSNKWRDVIYKGNDNYYLEGISNHSSRPAMGGHVRQRSLRNECADSQHLGASGGDL
jgi:hypothetical protein